MTVITGSNIIAARWMALRSAIVLHLRVPQFDRSKLLRVCKHNGFKGRTLKQARVWVDEMCDDVGLRRDAGIPSAHAFIKAAPMDPDGKLMAATIADPKVRLDVP